VRVWDASSGKELNKLEGHTSFVWVVAYNSSNDTIISGSVDNTVRVWDASSGKEVNKLEGHTEAVRSVAYNSSTDTIISGSEDKQRVTFECLEDPTLTWMLKRRIGKNRFLLTAKGACFDKSSLSPINAKLLEERNASKQKQYWITVS